MQANGLHPTIPNHQPDMQAIMKTASFFRLARSGIRAARILMNPTFALHPCLRRSGILAVNFATAVAAAVMLGAAPAANAQTLNVNIDNTVRTGLVGPAGGSDKTWNTISTNNGALKDENNATSTVTISGGVNGAGAWGNPALDMLKGATYTKNPINLVISGLTAGHNYDLYIGCYYPNEIGAIGSFSTTNTTTTVGAQSCDNGGPNGNGATWVEGVNYVRFQAIEPDGTNKITVSYTGVSTAYCMVSGLQLVDNSPPVAPPTPANLAATPYYAKVGLAWADALGATGYKVKRATASDGPYTELVPAPTTTTFTDATVAPATTYYYKVAATNVGGDSADSDAVEATTWTAPQDQSITFTLGLTVSKPWNNSAFADGATATSGLPVTYSSDNEAVATVDASGTVTLTGVLGTAHILADQPGDANFNAAPQVSQELTVTKATPVITWNEPVPIIVGTALGSTQLNATSGGVDGGFVYTPDSGTVLAAGSHTLSVQFTPTDSSLYDTPAAKQVTQIVSLPPWLNVNFDNVTRSGLEGPVGGQGTTWNTIPLAAGTTSSLLDSSNAATTVGVTRSTGGDTWNVPPLAMLIAGLYVGNGSTGTVAITGLTAGMKYDLYIGCYYKNGGSKARFATTNTTTTVGDQLCDNGGPNGNGATWVRGVNYAAFFNMEPDANNTITFTVTGNGTYGMVNGLQLVEAGSPPVSDYSTWASTNAPGQTPDQDHDNDGVENGIEYFMGQTGSSFTAMPGLDATNTVSWTMDAAYQGTYEVQTSPNLATWTNVDPRPLPSGGSLSYTLPSGAGKQFLRLLVTPAP